MERENISGNVMIDNIKEILDNNSTTNIRWKEYINREGLAVNGYSPQKLAQKCGFNIKTVKRWCNLGHMPKGRNEFIKLGFGIGLDFDKINNLLQRYGKYPKLYPKSIEDAIFIFSINKKRSFAYATELKKIVNKLVNAQPGFLNSSKLLDTIAILRKLERMVSDNELIEFISLNSEIFNDEYRRLVEFLTSHIKKITSDYTGLNQDISINALLKDRLVNSNQIKSYNVIISSLINGRMIPTRARMICLGIILDMNIENIDRLLELSGMEKLCAKDRVESVLIFLFEDYEINDPSVLVGNLYEKLWNTRDDQLKERYINMIRNLQREYENSDYSDADISEYIKRVLSDIDDEEIKDFLGLL